MKLIQSDNWMCVVASFAMAMDTTIANLLGRVGHDGKEVVVDNIPEPESWRSFHPEEFVDLLADDGYGVTMFSLAPAMIHGPQVVNHAAFLGEQRFFNSLLYGSGVIFAQLGEGGRGHAVAWNRETTMIHDPRGRVYQWKDKHDLLPRQFYLIQKVYDG